MCPVVDRLAQRLVPDTLWDTVKPLLTEFTPRPQGGATAPADERAVFTAVVFVLTSGCAWRLLPLSFGVSVPTAHRRFMVWAQAGVFDALHREILDRLGVAGELDWSAASVRAKKGDRLPAAVPSIVGRRDPRSRCFRCERNPAGHRCFRRKHPRLGDAAADGRPDPAGALEARPAPRKTRQAACR
jgi:transposase